MLREELPVEYMGPYASEASPWLTASFSDGSQGRMLLKRRPGANQRDEPNTREESKKTTPSLVEQYVSDSASGPDG